MDTTDVEEIVTRRFAEIMNLSQQEINLDASLAAEYGVTSVNALKLISEIEVEFDIDIDEAEARSIQKLNDVIELIKRKLA
jgi:acyl carrier protein